MGISGSWANNLPNLAWENPCCPCTTQVSLPLQLGVTCLQGVSQQRAWGDAVAGGGSPCLPLCPLKVQNCSLCCECRHEQSTAMQNFTSKLRNFPIQLEKGCVLFCCTTQATCFQTSLYLVSVLVLLLLLFFPECCPCPGFCGVVPSAAKCLLSSLQRGISRPSAFGDSTMG